MLVLGRFSGQSILIGDSVSVTIIRIGDGTVRVGVSAPPHVDIVRAEILERALSTIARLFQ